MPLYHPSTKCIGAPSRTRTYVDSLLVGQVQSPLCHRSLKLEPIVGFEPTRDFSPSAYKAGPVVH